VGTGAFLDAVLAAADVVDDEGLAAADVVDDEGLAAADVVDDEGLVGALVVGERRAVLAVVADEADGESVGRAGVVDVVLPSDRGPDATAAAGEETVVLEFDPETEVDGRAVVVDFDLGTEVDRLDDGPPTASSDP